MEISCLMTTISMRQKDIRPAPARIEFKGMKFLITDRPSDLTMQTYLMVNIFLVYDLFNFSTKCPRKFTWNIEFLTHASNNIEFAKTMKIESDFFFFFICYVLCRSLNSPNTGFKIIDLDLLQKHNNNIKKAHYL